MTELHYSTPLLWPGDRPTTAQSARTNSPEFKHDLTFADALEYLRLEISELDCANATVHSNYSDIANDRTRKKNDASTGVSISFNVGGTSYLLACDRWMLGQHNLYALHLGIRSLRMFPKWGLAEIETAFRGFMASQRDAVATATGTQISGQEPWLLALGLGPSATVHDANATYRARAKQVASNPEALLRLNAAIETARKFLPE